MGEVIRAGAATDDIFEDLRTTLKNASAKGGEAKDLALERLGPVRILIDTVDADLAAAATALEEPAAELKAENDRADAVIDRTYDDIWNDLGRPATDRYLTLIFPGGAGYYTDGDTFDQPQRMELLARLLERKLHPKLTAEQCTAYAQRIRDAASALAVDVEAVRLPIAQVKLLERLRTALGRTAQFDLGALKRDYKNAGMTEAQIHAIIPDRPTAPKKKPAKADPAATAKKEPPAAGKKEPAKEEAAPAAKKDEGASDAKKDEGAPGAKPETPPTS